MAQTALDVVLICDASTGEAKTKDAISSRPDCAIIFSFGPVQRETLSERMRWGAIEEHSQCQPLASTVKVAHVHRHTLQGQIHKRL